jgi:hypothetical protein
VDVDGILWRALPNAFWDRRQILEGNGLACFAKAGHVNEFNGDVWFPE